ncbi:MAG: hypothetical protein ACTHLT_06230 [Devosia sp.]
MRLLPTLALFLTLATAPAVAEDWERYVNGDLGFSISVPMDSFAVTAESSGRVSMKEIGGTAQLDIFGVRNPQALSRREFERMMETADPNRRITYRAAGRSWFVLSGYLEDVAEPTIFYAKFMLNRSGTSLSAFEISYPRAEKAAYDAIVEGLEGSLTAPD